VVREQEIVDEAAGQLEGGSPQIAIETVSELLADGTRPLDPSVLASALQLLARIYERLGLAALADLCRSAGADSVDADALYRVAHALLDHPHLAFSASFAATLLDAACVLAPNREDVLIELVAALETEGRFDRARDLLRQTSLDSFVIRYLLVFQTLMLGDVHDARQMAERLVPLTADEQFMRAELAEIFYRVDVVRGTRPLDAGDLRGWHFVLTGSLLLHVAPPGPGAVDGRYGYIEDSEQLCLEGIRRLAAVFDLWKIRIPLVQMFPNPASLRFGRAVASVLGVRARETMLPETKGLFVAYDLNGVSHDLHTRLRTVEPGRMVFTHATRWSVEQAVTPDFTTLLYERIVSSWDRYAIFPPRPGLPAGPPVESDKAIGTRIARTALPPTALDDLPSLLSLADAARDAMTMRRAGTRRRLWVARPVRNGRSRAIE
jgi:hypothetical protein